MGGGYPKFWQLTTVLFQKGNAATEDGQVPWERGSMSLGWWVSEVVLGFS